MSDFDRDQGARGAAVRLSIEEIDLLEAEIRLRYLEPAPELAANTGSDEPFAEDGEQTAAE